MDRRGVRMAIRVNLEMEGEGDPVRGSGGGSGELAGRIQGLGWHIQIFCLADMVAALADRLADLPVPIVLDRSSPACGPAKGSGQAGFEIAAGAAQGRQYPCGKASGAYLCSAAGPGFRGSVEIPFARAVIAANVDRVVWGSNWPHPDGTRGQDPIRGQAVPADRRRPNAEPAGDLGRRRGHAPKDPGRQSGAASYGFQGT